MRNRTLAEIGAGTLLAGILAVVIMNPPAAQTVETVAAPSPGECYVILDEGEVENPDPETVAYCEENRDAWQAALDAVNNRATPQPTPGAAPSPTPSVGRATAPLPVEPAGMTPRSDEGPWPSSWKAENYPEDSPLWDCRTDGNGDCGALVAHFWPCIIYPDGTGVCRDEKTGERTPVVRSTGGRMIHRDTGEIISAPIQRDTFGQEGDEEEAEG